MIKQFIKFPLIKNNKKKKKNNFKEKMKFKGMYQMQKQKQNNNENKENKKNIHKNNWDMVKKYNLMVNQKIMKTQH